MCWSHEPRWLSRLDTKESSDGARGYCEIWYWPRRVLSDVQGWVFSVFHGLARGLLPMKQSRFVCRSNGCSFGLFCRPIAKVNAQVKNRQRESLRLWFQTRFQLVCFQEHQPAFGLEALPIPSDLPFHPLNVKGKEIEAWPDSHCHLSLELHSPCGRVSHHIRYWKKKFSRKSLLWRPRRTI